METIDVSGLKNNPSEALRKSHLGVVVVLNRDKPDALLVGIELSGILDARGARPAVAAVLFRDEHLSLARAVPLAEVTLGDFVAHVPRLGVPMVSLDTMESWLASC